MRTKSSEHQLTRTALLAELHYDPKTGLFRRVVARGNRAAGEVTGWKATRGYVFIGVAGSTFPAHRLAWLYVTGAWPKGVIDHINGCTGDNRWENLRDVSCTTNSENQRQAHRRSASGLLGVTLLKGRPRAAIRVKGKLLHLGTFDTAIEAHHAYLKAKRDLHDGCTI